MLAFLDIPVDCRMSGAVDQEGDVRFTVGGPYDEFEIEHRDGAQFAYGAEALRTLATLSDALAQTGAASTPQPQTAPDGAADTDELAGAARRSA